MSLLIGFLTFILVMNCLFLMLLILIQLPKKEAGAGIAFGGAATDALFGAGSGNALTKLTKYSAGLFMAMSVLLSVLNMHQVKAGSHRLEQELSKPVSASTPSAPPSVPTVARTVSNSVTAPTVTPTPLPALSMPSKATNLMSVSPAATSTNPPAK